MLLTGRVSRLRATSRRVAAPPRCQSGHGVEVRTPVESRRFEGGMGIFERGDAKALDVGASGLRSVDRNGGSSCGRSFLRDIDSAIWRARRLSNVEALAHRRTNRKSY